MKLFNVSIKCLPMLLGYGAVILSMLACAVLSGSPQPQEGDMQVDNGVIKVKLETGEWAPVAGKSTFALVGKLENMNPWTVSGKTLSTNESTGIDEGLQVGDLVRVQGTVLDDNTWLAYSIQHVQEQTDSTVVLIGVVDSVNPWVVNGTKLNVTDKTQIEGDIKPGMIVRVLIHLLDDGTWEVLRISPFGDSTEQSGCVTVVATVVSVSGDQIQFLGWPDSVTFSPENQNVNDNNNNNVNNNDNENEDQNENDNDNENGNGSDAITSIGPGDTVSAVACVVNGQLVIVKFTILDKDEEGSGTENNGEKVLVCHKPGKNQHTLSLPPSAVPAHLGHGDTLGACP